MTSGDIVLNGVFYVFALAAVGGSVAVAISRNIVRSAFALLAVLGAVAAFYAFMRADFIFAAQILIYVGGILVLIIFAIMLTHRITDVKVSNESTPGPAAFFACLCVLFSLIVVIATYRWTRVEKPVERTLAGDPEKRVNPLTLSLAMWQADGSTGVTPGGLLLGGRGALTVQVGYLPADATSARVTLQHRAKATDAWKPYELKSNGAGFVQLPNSGMYEARFELAGIPVGDYGWSAALAGEGESAARPIAVAFGTTGSVDFHVEHGLTKPIAMAFMGPYLLPFEVVSVLLLAALIGAAFLARKEVKA